MPQYADESSYREISRFDQGEITKQLGHTENGDVSNTVDPVELGSLIDSGTKHINPIK